MDSRRVATLVFTDMEGSTRLLASLGDAFRQVLERHRAILAGAVQAYRGRGYATGGDGCVFVFDSTSDAIAAAVDAQRLLATESWPSGVEVRVRMAIHAGEVTDLGDELFGMAMHQASRVLAVTQGGQILVSGTAVALVMQPPDGVSLIDLGAHRLRDLVRPVALH